MNAKQFENLLVQLEACTEAREWAKGKSLSIVWKTCKRGDWLLWLFNPFQTPAVFNPCRTVWKAKVRSCT